MIQWKGQYEELKRVVLEVDGEAVNTLTRMLPASIRFGLLTPSNTHRIPHNLHVCFASPMTVASHLQDLELLPLYVGSYNRGCRRVPFLPLSPLRGPSLALFCTPVSCRSRSTVTPWFVFNFTDMLHFSDVHTITASAAGGFYPQRGIRGWGCSRSYSAPSSGKGMRE